MFTSTCIMESIGCYGWNHLKAHSCLCISISLFRKWKLCLSKPPCDKLHNISTIQPMWFFSFAYDTFLQSPNPYDILWVSKTAIYGQGIYLFLSHRGCVIDMLAPSLLIRVLWLPCGYFFLSVVSFRLISKCFSEMQDSTSSLQTLPVLCPVFWDLTHFLLYQ